MASPRSYHVAKCEGYFDVTAFYYSPEQDSLCFTAEEIPVSSNFVGIEVAYEGAGKRHDSWSVTVVDGQVREASYYPAHGNDRHFCKNRMALETWLSRRNWSVDGLLAHVNAGAGTPKPERPGPKLALKGSSPKHLNTDA